MRTQLILTTAAFGLASAIGAQAQAVYSVNAVGYINLTIPAKKYILTANQLKAGGNTAAEVIPNAKDGTIIFRYAGAAGFVANGYEFGAWTVPGMKLDQGAGFFLQNNDAADQVITLVGEVPQGSPLTTSLGKGLNLVSSQVPQAGKLVADLKFPAAEGDVVFQWDTAGQKYKDPNGFEFGEWGKGEPNIAVGEGFFVNKAAAVNWDRTFSVSP